MPQGSRPRRSRAGRLPPSRGDPRRLRARRDQRPHQRAAPRRRLELAAGHGVHAPRADGLPARLPAADRPHHAHPPAQGGRRRRRLRPKGATHNERVVSLHSLLDADFYREGARVTPGPATPPAAARAAEALPGAVARPGHPGRRPAPRRHPARVAADRPEVPGRGRATLLGDDRRPPDPLRPARRVRDASSPKDERARLPSSSSSPPAPPRTRTAGCG